MVEGDDAYIANEVHARTQPGSLHSILRSIRLILDEANVVMVEGFFKYSNQKNEIALGCIEFLKAHSDELCKGLSLGNSLPATLKQVYLTLLLRQTSVCQLSFVYG